MLHFWEKHAPLLGQSGSVLVKNWFRLGKTGSVLGKTCSVFGKNGSISGRNWFGFWIGLDWIGTKLKSHKFGFGFSRFRTGCLQNKSAGSKLEG